MRRKLIFSFALVSFGFLLIALIVFGQAAKLERYVKNDIDLGSQFSALSYDLEVAIQQAQFSVSQGFITQNKAEFDLHMESAEKYFKKINASSRELTSEKFADFMQQEIEITDGEVKKLSKIEDVVSKLKNKTEENNQSFQKIKEFREKQIADVKSLDKEKQNLSKAFREQNSLSSYSKEKWSMLNRSVLTVLSSLSTRDLNFAGRGIFEDADKFYTVVKLSAQDRKYYSDLKEKFNSTLTLALSVSSSTNDFILFNETMNSAHALSNYIQTFAETKFKSGTANTMSAATSAKWTTLFVALVIGVFSSLIGVSVVKGLVQLISYSIQQISESNMNVKETGNELMTVSEVLSAASVKASANTEETSSSLTEVTSMISSNTENAKTCADLADRGLGFADNGQSQVKSLIKSMRQIEESSKKIQVTTDIINDIAFQTNLLALNAAVEAALAGEQGKGFAVVADAVRALAQRASSSSKEILTLINESVQVINEGVAVAELSDQALQQIVNSSKEVKGLVDNIAQASIEQSRGVSQINQAILELDRVTQETALSAQKAHEYSADLNIKTDEVSELIENLNLKFNGKSQSRELALPREVPVKKNEIFLKSNQRRAA